MDDHAFRDGAALCKEQGFAASAAVLRAIASGKAYEVVPDGRNRDVGQLLGLVEYGELDLPLSSLPHLESPGRVVFLSRSRAQRRADEWNAAMAAALEGVEDYAHLTEVYRVRSIRLDANAGAGEARGGGSDG